MQHVGEGTPSASPEGSRIPRQNAGSRISQGSSTEGSDSFLQRRLSWQQPEPAAPSKKLSEKVHKPSSRIIPPNQLKKSDSADVLRRVSESASTLIPALPLPPTPHTSPRDIAIETLSNCSSSHSSRSNSLSASTASSPASASSSFVAVSAESVPLAPPKPILTQLIEASILLDSHEESPRETPVLTHEGFLCTYLNFTSTSQLLTVLIDLLGASTYTDKQKENLMRFAMRLLTTPRTVPLNKEESDLIKALAAKASSSHCEKLKFKGEQLLHLASLPQDPPAAPPARSLQVELRFLQLMQSFNEDKPYKNYKIVVKEMANELHNYHLTILQKIRFDEFCKAHRKNYANAPHLNNATAFFNLLSEFAPHEITKNASHHPKVSARKFEFFIDLAHELYLMGDFNCFMALMTGIDQGYMTKMQTFVNKEHQTIFNQMKECINPIKNFGPLRGLMNQFEKKNTPEGHYSFVPWLGLFERDLFAIEENYRFDTQPVNLSAVINLATPIVRFLGVMRLCKPLACQTTDLLSHFDSWRNKYNTLEGQAAGSAKSLLESRVKPPQSKPAAKEPPAHP